ncbi:hypothetical protein PHYSODRAFT_342838, partial [Phytophthora sojae]
EVTEAAVRGVVAHEECGRAHVARAVELEHEWVVESSPDVHLGVVYQQALDHDLGAPYESKSTSSRGMNHSGTPTSAPAPVAVDDAPVAARRSPNGQPAGRPAVGELTATSGPLGHLAPISPAEVTQVTRSPASSFHLFIQNVDGHEHTHHVNRLSVVESVDSEPRKPNKTRAKCCSNLSFENPWVQKITALAVGVPGGILGVLPAVVLNNWLKSTAYLGSFCIASIITMGGFAALYGEVTGRLGGSSLVMDLRVGFISASFSFVVGIVFQATGLMSVIFGE